MEYMKFSYTNFKVSKIGIGTWKLGINPAEEISAIKYALNEGVNFIDTAEMYGTETLVSKAIKGYDRNSVFIATKVSPHNFNYDNLIKACNKSLERLNIKYIDLYQLHFPNYKISMKETFAALEYLVREGKVLSIGVSNFNLDELKKAELILKENKICSNQIEYSILVRRLHDQIINYCKNNKIEIIAYSPLLRGNMYRKRNIKTNEIFEELTKKYNATTAQIALSWLISKNTIPIPKSGSLEHMKENINAIKIKLSANDIKKIDDIKQRKSSMVGLGEHIIKHYDYHIE
ncbi:MAG: aldo/keto reductase [Candidatus Marsarchaeota archaeon]|nr:aldo/keto reductase [Candidatus Marsarchaeota archaeon]